MQTAQQRVPWVGRRQDETLAGTAPLYEQGLSQSESFRPVEGAGRRHLSWWKSCQALEGCRRAVGQRGGDRDALTRRTAVQRHGQR